MRKQSLYKIANVIIDMQAGSEPQNCAVLTVAPYLARENGTSPSGKSQPQQGEI